MKTKKVQSIFVDVEGMGKIKILDISTGSGIGLCCACARCTDSTLDNCRDNKACHAKAAALIIRANHHKLAARYEARSCVG